MKTSLRTEMPLRDDTAGSANLDGLPCAVVSDYERAIAMIDTIPRPNDVSTVSRFTGIARSFGSPHATFRSVLVGGTNGKGSTCHMIAGLLRKAGFSVGLAAKPHLYRFNERCRINDQEISDYDLVRLVRKVVVTESQLEGFSGLTNPERRYLVWFLYFAERHPDIVVCEVNEGGRYDITNVLTPELVVITSVGLDHQDTLGSTVEQIAWHKAGLIKVDRPVITGASGEALRVVESEARQCHAPVWRLGREIEVLAVRSDSSGTSATIAVDGVLYKDVRTPMIGAFQALNVALAVGVGHVLAVLGWPVSEETIRTGIVDVTVPGRLEVLAHDPAVIIDGAHNYDKAAALTTSLTELFPDQPIVMVVSTTQPRIEAIVPTLAKCAKMFVACRSRFPRAADPEAIAEVAKLYAPHVLVKGSVSTALREALAFAKREGGVVVVTGALITIGEVPRDLTNWRGDD